MRLFEKEKFSPLKKFKLKNFEKKITLKIFERNSFNYIFGTSKHFLLLLITASRCTFRLKIEQKTNKMKQTCLNKLLIGIINKFFEKILLEFPPRFSLNENYYCLVLHSNCTYAENRKIYTIHEILSSYN